MTDEISTPPALSRSNARTVTKQKRNPPPRLTPAHLSASLPNNNSTSSASPNSPSAMQPNPQANSYKTNEFKTIFGRSTITKTDEPARHKSGDDTTNGETIASAVESATAENDWEKEYMKLTPEDFKLIKRLGEGAAGTVRQVLHIPSNITMAKKSITADPNPSVRKQILRELGALRTCSSPNIVSFYGAFLDEEETTIAICMEYCEGGSLEDIYKRMVELGAIVGEGVLSRIADSVCKGLLYLHSKHVIHRDIKPSNILMTRQGEIKLCDFGVSGELIESKAETFTGTKYYMAPERIQGLPYAIQSDIWSLGLTLIEVAENQPALPPPGMQLAIFELLDYIVHQPMPELKPPRSPELSNFVATCLLKDPSQRPGPAKMLEHDFIKMWSTREVDTKDWIKQVWGWE